MSQHEYIILSRKTQGMLADAVEGCLSTGWQLVGGVFVHTKTEVTPNESGFGAEREEVTKFYQAMLRTIHKPSMGREAALNHATGEVTYSEN